jgi:hypothetical protein
VSVELIDGRGHRWVLRLDLEGAQLLRDHCGVDLVGAGGAQELLDRLVDPLFVVDVAFLLSRARCERSWFDDSFGQKDIARARTAIGSELRRFFPVPEAPAVVSKQRRRRTRDRSGWDLVWELAGETGLDPLRLTLRELFAAARGRARAEWRRSAATMAHVANLFRDPKERGKPWQVDDFDPFEQKEDAVIPSSIDALRVLLPAGARDMTKERRS